MRAAYANCVYPPCFSEVDQSTPNPLHLLLADPDADFSFVVVAYAQPYRGANSLFPYPSASVPRCTLHPDDQGAGEPKYFADRGTEIDGRIVSGRLIDAYNFESSIAPPGEFARSRTSFGAITIANEGDADDLTTMLWEGRRVETYVGGTLHKGMATEQVLSFDEYGQLFSGHGVGIEFDESRILIPIQDRSSRLDEFVQQNEYLGDGSDFEGDTSLQGRSKPVAIGHFFQAQPPVVNKDHNIYQYHDGAGSSLTAVRMKAAALPSAGDSNDLINAAVPDGQYMTDVSRGLIKVGGQVDGDITCDGVGVGGNAASDQVRYLVTTISGFLDPEELDAVSFAGFGNYQAGYWCGTSRVTARSLIDIYAQSIDGFWMIDRFGRFVIREHVDPYSETPIAVINADHRSDQVELHDSLGLERVATPSPTYRVEVGYKRYFHTQSGDSIDESVEPDQRQDYGEEYRQVTPWVSETTRALFPFAKTTTLESVLINQADALAIRDRIGSRDRKRKHLFRVTRVRGLFQISPGDVIELYSDRFGLEHGVRGVVLSISEDAASLTNDLQVLVTDYANPAPIIEQQVQLFLRGLPGRAFGGAFDESFGGLFSADAGFGAGAEFSSAFDASFGRLFASSGVGSDIGFSPAFNQGEFS